MKSALRDWLSVSYGMISILRIGSLRSPPPIRLRRTFPCSGGQNKTPRNTLFINGSTVSTGYSATACGGKVVAPATKGGMHFQRPQGGCMVFAAKGGIKNGAEGAVPPQWNGTSYLPRARARSPPVRRSRSQAEPWQPRAKGPAAGSTLTPVRACQPSGILESTAQVPVPIPPLNPQARKGLVHKLSQRRLS